MRKLLFIQPFLFIAFFAQGQDIKDQIKSLQLNSSPAYVILGVEPENIQRPNSPTDFLASVQSAIVNERLQPNFAMETSPYYWGKKKPGSNKFNALDYLASRNFGDNLARSVTLSFATSPSDSLVFANKKDGTGLGLGIHLQLFQGKLSENVSSHLLQWYESNHMNNILNQLVMSLEADREINDLDEWINEVIAIGSNKFMPDGEKEIIKAILKKKLNKNTVQKTDLARVRKLNEEIEANSEKAIAVVNQYEFPLTREGFMLELAAANASVAEESRWKNLSSAKTSIWITPSYRFNINKDPTITDLIDLMAVARITFNSKNIDSSDYVDAGGKLQWIHNRLSLSGEAIFRYLTKKPDDQQKKHTFRTAFSLSYKLNELVTFQATFGSNFDGNSTKYDDPSKMFAVGGFNFGFSNFFKKNKND